MIDSLQAPSLVISMPGLEDPNFHRAVVLLIERNDEGAFGLIVNRPTDTPVSELCTNLGLEWTGTPGIFAHRGGPVSTNQGFLLHGIPPHGIDANSREVAPGIFMALDMETFRSLCETPPDDFRIMLGYAGWGSGQLEAEVAAGSWLLAPASAELVFHVPAEAAWSTSVRTMGVDPAMLVDGSGVQ